MNLVAVVVAGFGVYDLLPLAGVPPVIRSVRALLAAGMVDNLTILVPPDEHARVAAICAGMPVRVCAELGDEVADEGEVVLVHEAARPFAPAALASAVIDGVRGGACAVVPVLPVTDTVKHVGPDGAMRGAADRATLRAVQTPMAYCRERLAGARIITPTDLLRECAAIGEPVSTVPGDPMAFPLRSGWDIELALTLLDDTSEAPGPVRS